MVIDSHTDLVVFDVEIANEVEAVGGWDATDKMGIGVAVLWESLTNRFRFYGPDDREALKERIEAADVVSGFNIVSFDLPVVYGVSRPNFALSDILGRSRFVPIDLFRIARAALGKGFTGPCGAGLGLQDIASRTLGAKAAGGKTAHGSEAPGMFQRGEIMRLCSYCLDDVTIERDLLLFAIDHGYLITGQGLAYVADGIRVDPLIDRDACDVALADCGAMFARGVARRTR